MHDPVRARTQYIYIIIIFINIKPGRPWNARTGVVTAAAIVAMPLTHARARLRRRPLALFFFFFYTMDGDRISRCIRRPDART